jgi:hypothetical protein
VARILGCGGGGGTFFVDCALLAIPTINNTNGIIIFFIKQFLVEIQSLKFSIINVGKN